MARMIMSDCRPTVIDLFSGVGGFSLGAARAGFDLVLAAELDKHAIAAHKRNFLISKHWEIDLSGVSGAELLEHAGLRSGDVDGLIGGPPCQGFSAIGKRRALDPRNSLFVKFFQLVDECQPRFFVAENVPGILSRAYDETRVSALSCVKNSYVVLEPIKLRASDYGAPTSRERVFFIGYRPKAVRELLIDDFYAAKVAEPIYVAEALRGLPADISHEWLTEDQSWRVTETVPSSQYWDRISDNIPTGVGDPESVRRYQLNREVSGCFGTRHSTEIAERYGSLRAGEKDEISKSVRLKLDGFCPTLRAGTGADLGSFQAVRPIHPTLPRVITPREAARLQGFPDWFRFAPTKWHSFRQIGNSVSPILAEAVLSVIRSHLTSSE